MPSEPTLVPPTPTITKPSTPGGDTSPGLDQVQAVFDRVLPAIKTRPTPEKSAPPEPPKAAETPTELVEPKTEKPSTANQPEAERPQEPTEEHKLPSFLEKALSVEPVKGEPEPPSDDWPEELPTFKNSEEAKARYKNWREKYNSLKKEINTVRTTQPQADQATTERVQFLENQNKEMTAVLQRMGVETHSDFQQQVIQPMSNAWNAAARIVKDAGGDPDQLARAISLKGKAHFEALDAVFEGMPESAKLEAHQAIAAYKRLDETRRNALANAPKTFEALHKKDLERQYANLNQQRKEMADGVERVIKILREDAKLEVLQKSDDPDAKSWNENADAIVANTKKLILDNGDMDKLTMAVALGLSADSYRKLWMAERLAHQKTQKSMKEHYDSEPIIGGSGAGNGTPESQIQDDLKKPFNEVFLREFHRAQARNR